MKLIAEAHTDKEIAEILHLSEKTVESHRGPCFRSSACATASSSCATRSGAVSSSPEPRPSPPARAERRIASTLPRVSRRLALVLIAVSVAALAAAVAATLAARSGDDEGPVAELSPTSPKPGSQAAAVAVQGRGSPQDTGAPTSRFETRMGARRRRLTALRGKVVALAPDVHALPGLVPARRTADSCSARQPPARRPEEGRGARAHRRSRQTTPPRSAQRFLAEAARRPPSRLSCSERLPASATDLARIRIRTSGAAHRAQLVRGPDRSPRPPTGRVCPIGFLTPESLANDIELLLRREASAQS